MSAQHYEVRYSDLAASPRKESGRIKLSSANIYRLLAPYVSIRFNDQLKAVAPLAVYLGLFQWLILGRTISDALIIGSGLLAVIIGLMLFMEGLKVGLMPFGEVIGNTLPRKASLGLILGVAFTLGVGVTFAEPAIGALQAAGSIVDPKAAPLLYSLLNHYTLPLVLIVGVGVGFAALIGILRFLYNWTLKPLIYLSVIPVLVLTCFALLHPHTAQIIGLAWDCGAVTTGPVTVPLVLALGIGVASAVGKGDSTLSGFGIVTLASLFPIIGVLLLALAIHSTDPSMAMEPALSAQNGTAKWYSSSPGLDIILGFRAIVPLVLFLLFVLRVLLKERLKGNGYIGYGIFLSILGMIVFNLGLTYGLAKLGDQAGGFVPGAFAPISGMESSPLFLYGIGVAVALAFAFFLGFGATMAEPALNAMGLTVENLTQGAFRKSMLLYSVSLGVGLGIMVGVAKLIFNIPLPLLLVPGYALALILTYVSSEEFVNVAWDSAGVTTGPVTVPLVLAMGLGFGKAIGLAEGFGILACASLFPVLSVLGTGLYVQYRFKRTQAKGAST